jgi:outer membrane protein
MISGIASERRGRRAKTPSVVRLIACSIATLLPFTLVDVTLAESIEDAWQRALTSNFKIRAAAQQGLAADAQLASANSERLPNLILGADYLKLNDAPTFEGRFGNVSSFAVPYFDEESTYYGATTILPLYTGGRITSGIKAAEAQRSVAVADKAHTISNVKLAVAKAYINVWRTRSAMGVASSHVKSLESHQKDVENLLNQGLVARNNLLAANVALADARQKLLEADNQTNLARADYNRLLNRELDAEFTLEPVATPATTPPLAELSSQALGNRADVNTLRHRSKVLEHNAGAAIAVSKPQLALSGTYLHNENKINAQNDVFAANIGMTWNVFDGGVSRHRGNQLQSLAAAVRAQEDELANLVKLQVRQSWLALEAARQRVEIAGAIIDQAEENLLASKNRYQAGLITNTEVLDAENLRVRARSNHDDAIYDATLAAFQLKYAAGLL